MTKFRAGFARHLRMIIDHQAHVRAPGDGQDFFHHAADFVGRRFFGAELDQIRAALAELLRHDLRRATLQKGRVHEGVELAI